jgi:hypothetical protein
MDVVDSEKTQVLLFVMERTNWTSAPAPIIGEHSTLEFARIVAMLRTAT